MTDAQFATLQFPANAIHHAAPFAAGDVVFSKTSGQRVRVVEVSDCGAFFDGVYIGNRKLREMPRQFHYRWNGWRVSNFKPE